MNLELPKRLFKAGCEPQVSHINNNCKMTYMEKLEGALPDEYEIVKRDPIFAKILAIHENNLGFSGKLLHSFMCRRLITDKRRELWFVFGNRPLRFSLQEFYAVTGLKHLNEDNCNVENFVEDKGFWSKAIKTEAKISMKAIMDNHLKGANNWDREDRLRLVYLCVIAGLIMAKDEKVAIPLIYIKLVMNLDNLRAYPWGRESFKLLVDSVIKNRKKLKSKTTYSLNGFSYAFQIWLMEAIPDFGTLLGRKLENASTETVRCSYWTGAARVSYDEIIQLESTFGSEDVIYPYISSTGNFDIMEAAEFLWSDEMRDGRVDRLKELIRDGNDWSDHIWEFVESDDEVENEIIDEALEVRTSNVQSSSNSGLKRSINKLPDLGAEKRKKKLLCQRSAVKHGAYVEDMKSFFEGMFQTSFSALEEKLNKRIDERLEKLENEFTKLKDSVTQSAAAGTCGEQSNLGVNQSQRKRTAENVSVSLHENSNGVIGNVSASLHEVFVSQTSDIDMEMSTQDFLQKTLGGLSQDSFVQGFDPTQSAKENEPSHPSEVQNSFGKGLDERWSEFERRDPTKDADYQLVYVSEESWNQLNVWHMSLSPISLQIGPSVFDKELANRIVGPRVWLGNKDMDAVMYLFRENTTLRRWNPDRVAFLNCLFGVQINTVYKRYLENKKEFKWDSLLLSYATGELPSHGKTSEVWNVDVDRIYAPLFVNGNHWASMCINLVQRTIEVFDCSGLKKNRHVEAFAVLIPRLVKEVQSPANKKHLTITPYSILHVPMRSGINKSAHDCGVYALKFIECHLLGLDMSLLDDDNINGARHKIASDLFQAANDTVLINRMATYERPKTDLEVVNIN